MLFPIKIGHFSVYTDGPYPTKFEKLYKGIIVVVDKTSKEDSSFYMAIRLSNKPKKCIWKRYTEEIHSIEFNDDDFSIFCDFDNDEKNKCLHSLKFEEEDVYKELKENIPIFLKEKNCKFEIENSDSGIKLKF